MTPPGPPPPKRPPPKPEGLPRAADELGARPGEPSPLRRPGAPTRPQGEPTVFVDPEPTMTGNRQPAPEAASVPPSRKDSPPGGTIAIHGKGWRITMPHVALTALLATLGTWFGKDVIQKGEQAELADVLTELREVRKDVKGLKVDVAENADEPTTRRNADRKVLNYVEETVTPVVASLRRLGVKLAYDGVDYDKDKASEVEFHAEPGPGSTAPPIQPKAVLPKRPQL
jgi:hypothetical protein